MLLCCRNEQQDQDAIKLVIDVFSSQQVKLPAVFSFQVYFKISNFFKKMFLINLRQIYWNTLMYNFLKPDDTTPHLVGLMENLLTTVFVNDGKFAAGTLGAFIVNEIKNSTKRTQLLKRLFSLSSTIVASTCVKTYVEMPCFYNFSIHSGREIGTSFCIRKLHALQRKKGRGGFELCPQNHPLFSML